MAVFLFHDFIEFPLFRKSHWPHTGRVSSSRYFKSTICRDNGGELYGASRLRKKYIGGFKWVFYSENGNEQSITVYNKGMREGFSLVKYPNGAMHYRGEYRNDQMVGIWTTYDEKGKVINEKDYGFPDE